LWLNAQYELTPVQSPLALLSLSPPLLLDHMASAAAVPADLKPIAAYLQRAREVKEQDPVMAYWCASGGASIVL